MRELMSQSCFFTFRPNLKRNAKRKESIYEQPTNWP